MLLKNLLMFPAYYLSFSVLVSVKYLFFLASCIWGESSYFRGHFALPYISFFR